MNSRTDATWQPPRYRRPQSWIAPRLGIEADGISLLLHAIAVVAVVSSMRRVDESERLATLGPLAVGGLVVGYLLSRTRVQDFVAHSAALWSGAIASIVAVVATRTSPGTLIDERGRPFAELLDGVWRSISSQRDQTVANDEMLAVLGVTAWLLAYCSSWVVYRRGWYVAGLAMPAVILLMSIRLDGRSGGLPLAVFVVAAIALAARQAISVRTQRWTSSQIPIVRGLPVRFVAAGLPVAILGVVLGSLLTGVTHQNLTPNYRQQLAQSWDSIERRLSNFIEGTGGSGNYASFPDSFDIGGDIDLGDEVVARVQSEKPYYLALRRYDVYDGQGWSSDVESTFRMDGDRPELQVTNVIFSESQPVALSGDVSQKRAPESATITVVRPKDDLIFTIETFSAATEQVFAVLGWQLLPAARIDVNAVSLSGVPVDLQSLVRSVRGAEFSVDPGTGAIQLTDPEVERSFRLAADRLAAYPVVAHLEVGGDGQLILVVDGRIPNYDDIEALFASELIRPGSDYVVTGLASLASPDDLAATARDYPEWVEDRYLALPESVTERTRAEAQRIAVEAGATNPFDQAWAIQQYLRDGTNFAYELNGPSPGSGQDWVDFFLFERQMGRCEQFATAMAVMVRALDIPARLVSGYNSASEIGPAGEYAYREQQAHTWVEVYFTGYGWVPFEPTINQDLFTYGSDEGSPSQSEIPPSTDEQTPEPTEELPAPETTPEPEATPEPNAGVTTANDDDSTAGTLVRLGLILAAGAAVAAVGWSLLSWRLSFRGLTPASALYARTLRVGQWFGVASTSSTTPNEFARSFARTLPGSHGAIRTITNAYYAERFGPVEARSTGVAEAKSAWKSLRRNLVRWRLRRRR